MKYIFTGETIQVSNVPSNEIILQKEKRQGRQKGLREPLGRIGMRKASTNI